jgi:hypothetical protein
MSNAGRIEQFCTGLILALVIVLPPKCLAAEPLYSFGDIEIVRIPENSSYELRIWSKVPYPSMVGVQCHTSARGFFIYLDLNPGLGARIQNPQKFTIWSDLGDPHDFMMLTQNGGAITADTDGVGLETQQQARAIIGILGSAKSFFAFSTAGRTARFDVTDLFVARKKFSELCAGPFLATPLKE